MVLCLTTRWPIGQCPQLTLLHSFIAFLVLLSWLYNLAFWLQFLMNLLTYTLTPSVAIWVQLTQSARMPKITNAGLSRSGTGCFTAVKLWRSAVSVMLCTFTTFSYRTYVTDRQTDGRTDGRSAICSIFHLLCFCVFMFYVILLVAVHMRLSR